MYETVTHTLIHSYTYSTIDVCVLVVCSKACRPLNTTQEMSKYTVYSIQYMNNPLILSNDLFKEYTLLPFTVKEKKN